MCEVNQTQVTKVRLLGFRGLYHFRTLLFTMFFLTYVVILGANILIIILVTTIEKLKIPMFFFLKHLATSDVMLTTSVVPLALDIIIKDEIIVSLASCMTQLYWFCISSYFQNFLIAAMSFDRYLAVCNPLRYSSLMNSHVFLQMIIGFWIIVFLLESSEILVICQFKFCGLDYIDHFFCDFGPILQMSTSDISGLMLQDLVISIAVIFLPFVFVIVTYIFIVVTILQISTSYGRSKGFSTCSSHLAMVCTYYGSLMLVYMAPSDPSSDSMNKYRSLLYIVVSPLMNPILYSLRNQEIKRALQKCIGSFKAVSRI